MTLVTGESRQQLAFFKDEEMHTFAGEVQSNPKRSLYPPESHEFR